LKRREKIGLIIFAVMITIAVTTAIFLPLPPDKADISLWLPENAIMAKGLASNVYLSGTVVTIPFETFQTLSKDFVEQKIIIAIGEGQPSTTYTVVVHYLGKDKDGFTYHAIQQYSNSLGIPTNTIRLEGNTLKYGVEDSWLGKVLLVAAEGVAGVLVLIVGFLPRLKDC
jgi:hypothetical protein